MSIFDTYEQEFTGYITEVKRKIGNIPELSGDEKTKEMKKAEKDLMDAREQLEQMDMEMKDTPLASRGKLKKKIDSYKQDLEDTTVKLKKAGIAMSNSRDRDELFAFDGSSEDQRAALIDNTERLDRTGRRLDDGHRVLLETTDVARGILADLNDQGEVIDRARNRLRTTDSLLGKAGKTLSRMINRAIQHKVVTAVIIIIALILIIIIVILILTK